MELFKSVNWDNEGLYSVNDESLILKFIRDEINLIPCSSAQLCKSWCRLRAIISDSFSSLCKAAKAFLEIANYKGQGWCLHGAFANAYYREFNRVGKNLEAIFDDRLPSRKRTKETIRVLKSPVRKETMKDENTWSQVKKGNSPQRRRIKEVSSSFTTNSSSDESSSDSDDEEELVVVPKPTPEKSSKNSDPLDGFGTEELYLALLLYTKTIEHTPQFFDKFSVLPDTDYLLLAASYAAPIPWVEVLVCDAGYNTNISVKVLYDETKEQQWQAHEEFEWLCKYSKMESSPLHQACLSSVDTIKKSCFSLRGVRTSTSSTLLAKLSVYLYDNCDVAVLLKAYYVVLDRGADTSLVSKENQKAIQVLQRRNENELLNSSSVSRELLIIMDFDTRRKANPTIGKFFLFIMACAIISGDYHWALKVMDDLLKEKCVIHKTSFIISFFKEWVEPTMKDMYEGSLNMLMIILEIQGFD